VPLLRPIAAMLLADVVATSARVSGTRSRGEKTALLAELLRRARPGEVELAVFWLSGRLRQGRIGLGWAAIEPALGAAVPAGTPALTLADADEAFARIAALSGPGSAGERRQRLGELMGRATADEQGFLVRLLTGELRQGALAGVLGEAVARAAGLPAAEVRRAEMLAGDLGAVARAALTDGRGALARFRLRLFQPLEPMLAQSAEDPTAALAALGEAALEHKLDGARVQVHKAGGEVRVYSRRLRDVGAAVPELVAAAAALPARELILDGEVIALRPDGTPHPFQVTMRRFGRKLDVERVRAELPLTPFFFDLLHLDGRDLIDRPAAERFAALAEAVGERAVPRLVTADPGAAEAFFAAALARGHEGLMAKDLAAPYAAGSRGSAWLKIKRVHTLDLVVLAAEWGHGRRRGWLSNLHLGARDPESGQYVMLGKTFKGLTDETLAWQTERLRALAEREERGVVHVRPSLVVEIAFSDVQESPQYPAGMALRFARVKRYRPDKAPEQADTLAAVRAIFAGP
jgi:DNA ligase-1